MSFTRRALLAGVCATAACSQETALSPPVGTLIDAHTHMFNAADLSVGNFINVVFCENYTDGVGGCEPGKSYGPALGRILKTIAHALAPSARSELAKLSHSALNIDTPWRDDDIDLADDPGRDEEALDRFKQHLGAHLEGILVTAADDQSPDGALLRQIDAELRAMPIGRTAVAAAAATKVEHLMGPESNMDVGAMLKWASWMCRSRNRIIKRYKQLYSGAGAPRLTNFVGLLVDYERWLDEAPKSTFADQMDLMARLRDVHPEMLSFAPFDPLREVMARRGQGASPLNDIKRRWSTVVGARRNIEGVKLYPPMGFKPIDNGALSNAAFPRHVVQRWQAAGGTGKIGDELDLVLKDFFRWAQDNDVPIVTHSGNSLGAGCNFGLRGGPAEWAKVLTNAPLSNGNPGLGLSNLRLSLGHLEDQLEDFIDEKPTSWGVQKGALLDLPNVYTDLSFIRQVLDSGEQTLATDYLKAVRKFGAANGGARSKKLLYGSDWIMLDQQRDSGSYFRRIQQWSDFSADEMRDLASENAKRFLKL